MRQTTPVRVLLAVLGLFALLFVAAWLTILWMGTHIIYDPHDQVKIAEFRHHDRTEKLIRLPWGTWIGRAKSDGSMTIICKDNTVAEGGYVTRNFAFEVTVDAHCDLTIEF